MTTNEPAPPLDTPATLNRMIIEATQALRDVIDAEDSTAKPGRALKASAELCRLLELRLALSGVLAPVGRPRRGPGRPADDEHQDHDDGGEHPGIYQVAAALRASLLELPAEQRAGAAAVLADAFPALLSEPLEPERLKVDAPPHLKPPRDAPPPWVAQEWRR
jgi:hypothetical protein